jgi:hypothetical protein
MNYTSIILKMICLFASFSNVFAQLSTKEIEKFSKTLLIVNFNHPYYKNIEFLKKLYSPFFPHIVFYSDGNIPHPEVTCLMTDSGRLISETLYDALNKNPGYEGYLFLEDDCVLNMWNCFSLDLNKVWLLPGFSIANLENRTFTEDWAWVGAFNVTKQAFSRLLPKDLEIIAKNFGKDRAIGTAADMFYFPGKFREDVMRMCLDFKNVYIEIAMPCILACLDTKENWEKVTVLWGVAENSLHENWPKDYTCIHPVKLSSVKNRELVERVFRNMLFQ